MQGVVRQDLGRDLSSTWDISSLQVRECHKLSFGPSQKEDIRNEDKGRLYVSG